MTEGQTMQVRRKGGAFTASRRVNGTWSVTNEHGASFIYADLDFHALFEPVPSPPTDGQTQRDAFVKAQEDWTPLVKGEAVGLANALRGRLGLPNGESAIVTVMAKDGLERLRAADVRASIRAGAVRLSFHVHNTEADVDGVARALGA